ncbi:hypothetical protein TWF569_001670 [Orbilia oligospora]|uniref:Uncharacterized protein n=2 Tax=Orbilia oligospora TaxID=2813651 RepID=G1XQZ9_ARTOA|nr:hypothetical protein AOL_s00188g361 [Orbilia oligospora ATCC 24927]KAF3082956.1 hypothetical protein TWF102_001045 [Orbilia oligospora]EGX44456.1 hypothetical protein AOL_s00188g361 [Orbilia oligospora ATCC 24927]KAF3083542.1 hypothetical protein TWF706_001157 [Orbilia oligospora]KAF3095048.1 hypothetical protein TWF103_010337 [Orbilia oligospora]KAF3122781.1 hypothetical protein TWF594_002751 [Orbilia oligospora]
MSDNRVTGLTVKYGREHEDGAVQCMNGGSADINHGQKGEYVFIHADRDPHGRGITDVRLLITDEDYGSGDLAKGAGGKYRYLICSEEISNGYITDVALYRGHLDSAPYGWKRAYHPDVSADINYGRGGDYLYFIYKGDLGPRQHR